MALLSSTISASGYDATENSSGTVVTTGDSGTVSNTMLANSSFNVGTTSISLGRASATQSLTGVSIDGNAGTVTIASNSTNAAFLPTFASTTESDILKNSITYIESIITGGPDAADSKIPISLTRSTVQNVIAAASIMESNKLFIEEQVVAYIDTTYSGFSYDKTKCKRDVKLILRQLVYDLQSGGNYYSVYSGLSYWSRNGTHHIVTLGEAVTRTDLFPDGASVNFYQRSYISANGYVFEYVGAGSNYGSLPQVGRADPDQTKEVVELNNGKVFFTSTDQSGDFRIGTGLVISQATGILSGRTFTKSLFANMTPFILAIEGGGI